MEGMGQALPWVLHAHRQGNMGEGSSLGCETGSQLQKPLSSTITSCLVRRAQGSSWDKQMSDNAHILITPTSNLLYQLKRRCNSCNAAGYPMCLLESSFTPGLCVSPVATDFLHLHVHQMENCSFLLPPVDTEKL